MYAGTAIRWPCRQQQPRRSLTASTRTAASLVDPLQLSSTEVNEQVLSSHAAANAVLGELGDGLEAPVQLLYLVTLLGFVVVGAYLVVRQVCSRCSKPEHVMNESCACNLHFRRAQGRCMRSTDGNMSMHAVTLLMPRLLPCRFLSEENWRRLLRCWGKGSAPMMPPVRQEFSLVATS